MKESKLREYILSLLEQAGFPPEQYVIKAGVSSVEVHFDSPAAVEYFRGEVDNCEYADSLIFEYRKTGKRHIAYIQEW